MSLLLTGRIVQCLPEAWRAELASIPAEPVTTGMGGAELFRLQTEPVCFLKVAEADAAQDLRQEIARTAWLAGHGVRVARIVRTHDSDNVAAMQTLALPGDTADRCGWPKDRLLASIGRALAALHALPVVDCPFDERLAIRLGRARDAVERGHVDASHFDVRNLHVTPRELLARLVLDPPPEDIVVAHGDATLNNIVVAPDGSVGFIDCGHVGRADRYLDLGVLAAEIADRFGDDALNTLALAYGAAWDAHKAAYYADLYEFF